MYVVNFDHAHAAEHLNVFHGPADAQETTLEHAEQTVLFLKKLVFLQTSRR